MHKLSYKTLLIIIVFLLIGIVGLLKLNSIKKVSAAWWNDSWMYRQAINISSHNTTESNVYIIATINIGTTAKAHPDDGDFRFTTQTGDLLPYYISAGVGTTAITFHIQFSSFPAGAQTIYAYYGNPSAQNGFSASDFATEATNYVVGSPAVEEIGGGPVAYWKFDEGVDTTTYDSTLNQNNGILGTGNSAPTWANESQCVSGKCLQFNGINNYLSVPNSTSLNPTGSFTISLNVYSSSLPSNETNFIGKNGYQEYRVGITTSGYIHTTIQITDGTTTKFVDDYGSPYFYPQLNHWYHYEYVFDANLGYIYFYVNGKLFNSKSVGSGFHLVSNTQPLILGSYNTSYFFPGLIDETKIYPYARTAAQIKQDYNSRGSSSGSSANLGIKSSTAPDLNSKLIAYWKFDEGNDITTHDSSPQNNNATLKGTTLPTWTDGKYNKAVSFINVGTTSYVEANYKSVYDATNNFTLSTWVNPSSFTSQPFLVGHYYQYGLYLNSSGAPSLILRRSDGIYSYVTSSKNIPLNQWSHVSTTFKDGVVRFYINGTFVSTQTIPTTTLLSIAANSVTIGIYFNKSANPLAGSLDEVKIYNTALTDDEIKMDYNRGSAIQMGATNQTIGGTTTSLEYCIPGDTSPCSNPIAEWNFEENTGNIAKDTSGNNLNGTFGTGNSAPTWTTGKNNSGSGLDVNTNGQYIKVPLGSSISKFNTSTSGKSLSFSLWFKADNVSSSSQHLITNNEACNNPGNFILNLSAGNLYFNYYSSGGSAQVTQSFTPSIALQNNRWYHLEWTKTFGQLGVKAYLNGIPQTVSGDSTLTGYGNLNNIVLGAWSGTGYTCGSGVDEVPPIANMSFIGSIDQIKIYDYARTASQVAYDYNKGAPIGWWKLDECQGNIAHDSSGIGNTGSINIGASGTQNSLGTCQVGTSAAWTAGASGKYNGSLNFDGVDDYMTVPISVSGSDATIVFWVKNPAAGAGAYLLRSSANVRTYITISGNNIGFTKGNPAVGIPSTSVTPSNWNHIVLKWWTTSGTTYGQGYINGKPIGIGTSFTDNTQGNYVTVAGFSTTGTQNASGQFDDIRVYNYALTSTQIKTLYNNGAISFN